MKVSAWPPEWTIQHVLIIGSPHPDEISNTPLLKMYVHRLNVMLVHLSVVRSSKVVPNIVVLCNDFIILCKNSIFKNIHTFRYNNERYLYFSKNHALYNMIVVIAQYILVFFSVNHYSSIQHIGI